MDQHSLDMDRETYDTINHPENFDHFNVNGPNEMVDDVADDGLLLGDEIRFILHQYVCVFDSIQNGLLVTVVFEMYAESHFRDEYENRNENELNILFFRSYLCEIAEYCGWGMRDENYNLQITTSCTYVCICVVLVGECAGESIFIDSL